MNEKTYRALYYSTGIARFLYANDTLATLYTEAQKQYGVPGKGK